MLFNLCSLSFYKEELAGEDKNYVHLRAAAQRSNAEDVLRQLVEDVVESACRMEALTVEDPELTEIWARYFQVRDHHMRTLACSQRHCLV